MQDNARGEVFSGAALALAPLALGTAGKLSRDRSNSYARFLLL